MKPLCSTKSIRQEEERLFAQGVGPIELMDTVGSKIAKEAEKYQRILIVCGNGNNAGDGYAAAYYLSKIDKDVTVLLIGERFTESGRYFYEKIIDKCISGYENINFSQYDLIIDCLYGIGFHGRFSDKERDLAERINASSCSVISADIPSGLNADNGVSECCVIADKVVAAGMDKFGYYLNSGKDYCKEIITVDLGFKLQENAWLFETTDCVDFLQKRKNDSHKGAYGYTAIFGGSRNFSGAVKLANLACSALYSGSGVVRLCVPEEIFSSVSPYLVESTLYSENDYKAALSHASAVGVGCGWGRTPERASFFSEIINNADCPVILDADGLYAWKALGLPRINNLIVTPHYSEMAHIAEIGIDEVRINPVETARSFSLKNNCITVLKGPSTIVTDGKQVIVTSTGCSGMATAGSGDVLLGVLTAIIGQRFDNTLKSVAYATFINGFSGGLAEKEFSDIGMTSLDTTRFIRPAIQFLRKCCGIN